MGREFIATDLMEDQTSSCTCSEASPFNCTCPRTDPPLLPSPLIPALNHNSGVRDPENIARASSSLTSNVGYTQRIPVGFRPPRPRPMLRPVARHVRQHSVRLRPVGRHIGESDPPLFPTPPIYALNHSSGVRESANIVRASESETSIVEYVQSPVGFMPHGLRPVTRYTGDTLGGWIVMQDGRSVGVSQEFLGWAIDQPLSEVENAIMADYPDLERMNLLSIY